MRIFPKVVVQTKNFTFIGNFTNRIGWKSWRSYSKNKGCTYAKKELQENMKAETQSTKSNKPTTFNKKQ